MSGDAGGFDQAVGSHIIMPPLHAQVDNWLVFLVWCIVGAMALGLLVGVEACKAGSFCHLYWLASVSGQLGESLSASLALLCHIHTAIS